MKLKDIKLGYADGKQESELESFSSMFYKDELTYGKLKEEESIFIISGSKGVGKTLLSQYFMDRRNTKYNALCKTISMKDIELTCLLELKGKDIKLEEYKIYLKYSILIEIAKLLVKNSRIDKQSFKDRILYWFDIRRLKKFINERYPSSNFKSQITEKEVSSDNGAAVSLNKSQFSFKRKETINQQIVLTQYYEIVEKLEEIVLHCLKYQNVVIATDDIDETDEVEIASKDYKRFLLSYISACKELNEKICKKSKSRCLVIVRDDILNSLNSVSGNFNKVIADRSILIDWKEKGLKNPWEYKMAKMIITKIRTSIKSFENKTDEFIFNEVFPLSINGKDVFRYLITSSLGRPREVIYWLKTIIDIHNDATKFHEQYFNESYTSYSEHLKGDLKNEMSFYFESNYIDELFDLIVVMDKSVFKLQNAQFAFDTHKNRFTHIDSVENALKNLYDFGVIGNKIELPNEKSRVTWVFDPEGKKKFKLEEKFTVHYGLRKALLTR